MRYQRQILVPEIKKNGQALLANARVLCVGMGGLGCPSALYLAGAGVGTLGLMDGDEISVSNLHRQVLYSTAEVGQKKVDAAQKKLRGLNPEIEIRTHAFDLCAENAIEVFSQYDLILDGTDRFSAKFLINDACVKMGLPWIYASVSQWEGQIAVFDSRVKTSPCYRCFSPRRPKCRFKTAPKVEWSAPWSA